MFDWLRENWINVAVPVLVFLASYILGLWVRRIAFQAFDRWVKKVNWEGGSIIVYVVRSPFVHWFWLLGAYIAIHISIYNPVVNPPDSKLSADSIIASLFIISITWVIANLSGKLCRHYMSKVKRLQPSITLIVNIIRITISIIGFLIFLDMWGVPTTPILLFLFAAILLAILACRNLIVNIFSGFQLARGEQIEVGDFVRLGSGEEGYIAEIAWRTTQIRALDGNLIIIPNGRLLQSTIVNYGRPLVKAQAPFKFYSLVHLKELTGLKASNLTELASILKKAPGSVIYYHTHNFLEEYQYLTPEPANDFALWVKDELGNEMLGEKLACIDTFGFPTIAALRDRIISVIEDYLSKYPDDRKAVEGGEFHLIKSISMILPTPYIVHDLREFVEVLRKVSISSINYHVFESRLRLKRGVNDFSIWIMDCLGDKDLADKLADLDPYNFTLEGLRSMIIQLIEKRIK
jgi:small-conductance mechanosensitive channel